MANTNSTHTFRLEADDRVSPKLRQMERNVQQSQQKFGRFGSRTAGGGVNAGATPPDIITRGRQVFGSKTLAGAERQAQARRGPGVAASTQSDKYLKVFNDIRAHLKLDSSTTLPQMLQEMKRQGYLTKEREAKIERMLQSIERATQQQTKLAQAARAEASRTTPGGGRGGTQAAAAATGSAVVAGAGAAARREGRQAQNAARAADAAARARSGGRAAQSAAASQPRNVTLYHGTEVPYQGFPSVQRPRRNLRGGGTTPKYEQIPGIYTTDDRELARSFAVGDRQSRRIPKNRRQSRVFSGQVPANRILDITTQEFADPAQPGGVNYPLVRERVLRDKPGVIKAPLERSKVSEFASAKRPSQYIIRDPSAIQWSGVERVDPQRLIKRREREAIRRTEQNRTRQKLSGRQRNVQFRQFQGIGGRDFTIENIEDSSPYGGSGDPNFVGYDPLTLQNLYGSADADLVEGAFERKRSGRGVYSTDLEQSRLRAIPGIMWPAQDDIDPLLSLGRDPQRLKEEVGLMRIAQRNAMLPKGKVRELYQASREHQLNRTELAAINQVMAASDIGALSRTDRPISPQQHQLQQEYAALKQSLREPVPPRPGRGAKKTERDAYWETINRRTRQQRRVDTIGTALAAIRPGADPSRLSALQQRRGQLVEAIAQPPPSIPGQYDIDPVGMDEFQDLYGAGRGRQREGWEAKRQAWAEGPYTGEWLPDDVEHPREKIGQLMQQRVADAGWMQQFQQRLDQVGYAGLSREELEWESQVLNRMERIDDELLPQAVELMPTSPDYRPSTVDTTRQSDLFRTLQVGALQPGRGAGGEAATQLARLRGIEDLTLKQESAFMRTQSLMQRPQERQNLMPLERAMLLGDLSPDMSQPAWDQLVEMQMGFGDIPGTARAPSSQIPSAGAKVTTPGVPIGVLLAMEAQGKIGGARPTFEGAGRRRDIRQTSGEANFRSRLAKQAARAAQHAIATPIPASEFTNLMGGGFEFDGNAMEGFWLDHQDFMEGAAQADEETMHLYGSDEDWEREQFRRRTEGDYVLEAQQRAAHTVARVEQNELAKRRMAMGAIMGAPMKRNIFGTSYDPRKIGQAKPIAQALITEQAKPTRQIDPMMAARSGYEGEPISISEGPRRGIHPTESNEAWNRRTESIQAAWDRFASSGGGQPPQPPSRPTAAGDAGGGQPPFNWRRFFPSGSGSGGSFFGRGGPFDYALPYQAYGSQVEPGGAAIPFFKRAREYFTGDEQTARNRERRAVGSLRFQQQRQDITQQLQEYTRQASQATGQRLYDEIYQLETVEQPTTEQAQRLNQLKAATKEFPKLLDYTDELAKKGRITSTTLQSIGTSAGDMARRFKDSDIQIYSDQVGMLGAQYNNMNAEFRKANIEQKYLIDAGPGLERSMLASSSAAQGMILGMAALEGNITNLAFSMVFLRFSALAKLSLGIAAFTLVVGKSVQKVQELIDKNKEQAALAAGFATRTRTGSSQAEAGLIEQGAAELYKYDLPHASPEWQKDFYERIYPEAMAEVQFANIDAPPEWVASYAITRSIDQPTLSDEEARDLGKAIGSEIVTEWKESHGSWQDTLWGPQNWDPRRFQEEAETALSSTLAGHATLEQPDANWYDVPQHIRNFMAAVTNTQQRQQTYGAPLAELLDTLPADDPSRPDIRREIETLGLETIPYTIPKDGDKTGIIRPQIPRDGLFGAPLESRVSPRSAELIREAVDNQWDEYLTTFEQQNIPPDVGGELLLNAESIEGYHTGGRNIAEGRYLVGERGPEIVDIPSGTDIFNSKQTSQMMSSEIGGIETSGFESSLVKVENRAGRTAAHIEMLFGKTIPNALERGMLESEADSTAMVIIMSTHVDRALRLLEAAIATSIDLLDQLLEKIRSIADAFRGLFADILDNIRAIADQIKGLGEPVEIPLNWGSLEPLTVTITPIEIPLSWGSMEPLTATVTPIEIPVGWGTLDPLIVEITPIEIPVSWGSLDALTVDITPVEIPLKWGEIIFDKVFDITDVEIPLRWGEIVFDKVFDIITVEIPLEWGPLDQPTIELPDLQEIIDIIWGDVPPAPNIPDLTATINVRWGNVPARPQLPGGPPGETPGEIPGDAPGQPPPRRNPWDGFTNIDQTGNPPGSQPQLTSGAPGQPPIDAGLYLGGPSTSTTSGAPGQPQLPSGVPGAPPGDDFIYSGIYGDTDRTVSGAYQLYDPHIEDTTQIVSQDPEFIPTHTPVIPRNYFDYEPPPVIDLGAGEYSISGDRRAGAPGTSPGVSIGGAAGFGLDYFEEWAEATLSGEPSDPVSVTQGMLMETPLNPGTIVADIINSVLWGGGMAVDAANTLTGTLSGDMTDPGSFVHQQVPQVRPPGPGFGEPGFSSLIGEFRIQDLVDMASGMQPQPEWGGGGGMPFDPGILDFEFPSQQLAGQSGPSNILVDAPDSIPLISDFDAEDLFPEDSFSTFADDLTQGVHSGSSEWGSSIYQAGLNFSGNVNSSLNQAFNLGANGLEGAIITGANQFGTEVGTFGEHGGIFQQGVGVFGEANSSFTATASMFSSTGDGFSEDVGVFAGAESDFTNDITVFTGESGVEGFASEVRTFTGETGVGAFASEVGIFTGDSGTQAFHNDVGTFTGESGTQAFSSDVGIFTGDSGTQAFGGDVGIFTGNEGVEGFGNEVGIFTGESGTQAFGGDVGIFTGDAGVGGFGSDVGIFTGESGTQAFGGDVGIFTGDAGVGGFGSDVEDFSGKVTGFGGAVGSFSYPAQNFANAIPTFSGAVSGDNGFDAQVSSWANSITNEDNGLGAVLSGGADGINASIGTGADDFMNNEGYGFNPATALGAGRMKDAIETAELPPITVNVKKSGSSKKKSTTVVTPPPAVPPGAPPPDETPADPPKEAPKDESTDEQGDTYGQAYTGGRSMQGGRYLVGELGPELIDLPHRANVYNHRDTARMVGGGDTYLTLLVDVHDNTIADRRVANDLGNVVARKTISALQRQKISMQGIY